VQDILINSRSAPSSRRRLLSRSPRWTPVRKATPTRLFRRRQRPQGSYARMLRVGDSSSQRKAGMMPPSAALALPLDTNWLVSHPYVSYLSSGWCICVPFGK